MRQKAYNNDHLVFGFCLAGFIALVYSQILMKYVSNIFGTMNEEKTTTSKTIKGQNHSSTVSTRNQQVNVIEPHELGELSNHQVVSLYKQAKVIGRAVPYFENQLKKGSINKTPYS